jgi:hypothetical protein
VLTAPMAVARQSLITTGVLPPALLIITLFTVVLISPQSVTTQGLAPDAGTFARTLAATLDHGVSLVIGHALALGAITLRSVWSLRA